MTSNFQRYFFLWRKQKSLPGTAGTMHFLPLVLIALQSFLAGLDLGMAHYRISISYEATAEGIVATLTKSRISVKFLSSECESAVVPAVLTDNQSQNFKKAALETALLFLRHGFPITNFGNDG